MRWILLVALVVSLLAWLVLRPEDAGEATAPDATLTKSPHTAEAATAPSLDELERPADPRAVPAPARGTTRVRGRIVDEARKPLPDALVWIFAVDGEWKAGVEPPPLVVRGGLAHAFSAISTDDGVFEIVAPAPTGPRLRLEVETSDHRGHLFKDLVDKSAHVTIQEGDSDLGDIVVVVRGAILGRVLLAGGGPVRGAAVDLVGADESVFIPVCTTDADGMFVLSCVPAGTYSIGAVDPDVGETPRERVVLHARQRLEGVELVIEPARTLRGIVVDSDGAPISCVVHGYIDTPSGKPSGSAWAQTLRDGTFKMLLKDDAPHFLRCGGGTFADWTSLDTPQPWFRPGASGIRIELTQLAATVVTVLDARARSPIESFGWYDLSPPADEPLHSLGVPQPAHHDGGHMTVYVKIPPQRFVAWARGYEPRVQELSAAPTQVVLLEPLGSVRGRLARAGVPIEKARVVLRPLGEPAPASHGFGGDEVRVDPRGRTTSVEQQRSTVVRESWFAHAAADGSFALKQVDSGAWELLAIEDGSEVLRRVVPTITLGRGESLDVGTIEFPPGTAALRLRLIVDEPLQVREFRSMINVRLNGASLNVWSERMVSSDTWLLGSLAPGDVDVRVGAHSSLIGELASANATLVDAEERALDVDLRGVSVCRLTVQVDAPRELEMVVIQASGDAKVEFGASQVWMRRHPQAVVFLLRGSSKVKLTARLPKTRVDLAESTIELPARGAFETTLRIPSDR